MGSDYDPQCDDPRCDCTRKRKQYEERTYPDIAALRAENAALRDMLERADKFTVAQFDAFTQLPKGMPYRTSNAPHTMRVIRVAGISYDKPYRDVERWAVTCGTAFTEHDQVLGRDGEFDYQPRPSSRTDEWLREHRFETRDEAFAAADTALRGEGE